MRKFFLSFLWAVLYLVCGAVSCISVPEGFLSTLPVVLSILFFVPPAVMLHQAFRENDKKTVRIIRNLSLIWLITAVIMIICNILSVTATELTGRILYYTMAVITAPMVSGGNWFISLFLWACLLITSQQYFRKKK